MYTTTSTYADRFDWDSYYTTAGESDEGARAAEILANCRRHLNDNPVSFSVAMNNMLSELTGDLLPESIDMLELGAGTGFLTRAVLRRYAGNGTLVDSSREAYKAFSKINDPVKSRLTYRTDDIFTYQDTARYDVVCSFGLIEHFKEKDVVMKAHCAHIKPGGIGIIIVPMDSPLSRVYYEVHPELNLGYRELLTEKELRDIIIANGMDIIRMCKTACLPYDVLAAACVLMEPRPNNMAI